MTIKAPFPWFGGKRRVAGQIWERLGDVVNYVEPFAGTLAVLLDRPHWAADRPWKRTETVNDKDCWLANFWRAVQADPVSVAHHADRPVNEADVTAMRRWVFDQSEFQQRMRAEIDFYDAQIAGRWVWGVCASIANSFAPKEPPQLPHLGDPGRGINRQLPHLWDPGRGDYRRQYIMGEMRKLAARLRDVRVACGDWARVLTPTITERFGVTGIFLDPPYDSDCDDVYHGNNAGISADVYRWAIENGDNPLLRIVLCGYEGEHAMPADWECVAWKTAGGYGAQGHRRGRDNAHRERVWFSPACARQPKQSGLFDKPTRDTCVGGATR